MIINHNTLIKLHWMDKKHRKVQELCSKFEFAEALIHKSEEAICCSL